MKRKKLYSKTNSIVRIKLLIRFGRQIDEFHFESNHFTNLKISAGVLGPARRSVPGINHGPDHVINCVASKLELKPGRQVGNSLVTDYRYTLACGIS